MPLFARSSAPAPEVVPRPKYSIPFTRSKGGITAHALEHPPATIPVLWKKKVGRGTKAKVVSVMRFKINVPWMYFIVRMNRANAITDTFLFFTKKKAVDLNEPAYVPPLPNIYPSGHICNGTIRVSVNDPPAVKVAEAFNAFWSTPFTEETWPEDENLVPRCWAGSNRYYIEYGYLVYVFEYWALHDEKCPKGCFPWRHLRIRNKKTGADHGHVYTLDGAIHYVLDFHNYHDL